jgi:hypothetical protein
MVRDPARKPRQLAASHNSSCEASRRESEICTLLSTWRGMETSYGSVANRYLTSFWTKVLSKGESGNGFIFGAEAHGMEVPEHLGGKSNVWAEAWRNPWTP